jgi:hypothetical protein
MSQPNASNRSVSAKALLVGSGMSIMGAAVLIGTTCYLFSGGLFSVQYADEFHEHPTPVWMQIAFWSSLSSLSVGLPMAILGALGCLAQWARNRLE